MGWGGEGREILTPTTGYRGNNTVLKEVILQLLAQQLVKLWGCACVLCACVWVVHVCVVMHVCCVHVCEVVHACEVVHVCSSDLDEIRLYLVLH